jgi:hypothetical protein
MSGYVYCPNFEVAATMTILPKVVPTRGESQPANQPGRRRPQGHSGGSAKPRGSFGNSSIAMLEPDVRPRFCMRPARGIAGRRPRSCFTEPRMRFPGTARSPPADHVMPPRMFDKFDKRAELLPLLWHVANRICSTGI